MFVQMRVSMAASSVALATLLLSICGIAQAATFTDAVCGSADIAAPIVQPSPCASLPHLCPLHLQDVLNFALNLEASCLAGAAASTLLYHDT